MRRLIGKIKFLSSCLLKKKLKKKQARLSHCWLLTLTRFPEGKFKYHRNKNCLGAYEKLSWQGGKITFHQPTCILHLCWNGRQHLQGWKSRAQKITCLFPKAQLMLKTCTALFWLTLLDTDAVKMSTTFSCLLPNILLLSGRCFTSLKYLNSVQA